MAAKSIPLFDNHAVVLSLSPSQVRIVRALSSLAKAHAEWKATPDGAPFNAKAQTALARAGKVNASMIRGALPALQSLAIDPGMGSLHKGRSFASDASGAARLQSARWLAEALSKGVEALDAARPIKVQAPASVPVESTEKAGSGQY